MSPQGRRRVSRFPRLEIVPRSEIPEAVWDDFVAESPDGWLFHLSPWKSFAPRIPDVSFAIRTAGDEQLLAIAVAQVLELPDAKTGSVVTVNNSRAPLALRSDVQLTPLLAVRLQREAIAELRRLAARFRASRINLELPPIPGNGTLPSDAVLKSSNFVLQHQPAAVVDLTTDAESMWKSFRQGRRGSIRSAQKLGVEVRSAENIADVERFAGIHRDVVISDGGTPPPPEWMTNLWSCLASRGQCDLLLAVFEDQIVAGHLTLSYKGICYYQNAATDHDFAHTQSHSLLVYEALLRQRKRGDHLYVLGPAPARESVDERTYNIGFFKSSFGGAYSNWRCASLPARTPLKAALFAVRRHAGLARHLVPRRAWHDPTGSASP